MMLRYLNLTDHADKIENAVLSVVAEKKIVTKDLGGNATNSQFTQEICKRLA
jgi:isocitrate dehydrogenase (NAD+)